MNIPITLATFTADATGSGFSTQGGIYQIICENAAGTGDANYGGGTITLQTSHEGGGWQDVYDGNGLKLEISASADYASTIRINTMVQVRAVLAGSTSPDALVKLV